MTYRTSFVFCLLFAVGFIGLSGCANYLRPFRTVPAEPGFQTQTHKALQALPQPREKVVVGVYNFRDQTGQYKASNQGISYSTAVTQGATSILLSVLEDSGWFVPIERAALSNLLNERQIIQSVRQQYTGPEGESLGQLPPLLYAGVLLEGGIIGYDTNILTGGTGARYFGAGASGQFRRDRVTIYLRAVSVQNGKILKTVRATKTILSQKLSGNIFRFVEPNRLLEAEVGFSFNEPTTLAVTAAIEEAVKNLVIEGVKNEMWALANPGDIHSEAFRDYERSQEVAATRDIFGRELQPQLRRGLSIGISGDALLYDGDYRNALVRPGGGLHIRGQVAPGFSLGMNGWTGEIAADSIFSTTHAAADIHGRYYMLPGRRFSPYVMAGTGLLVQWRAQNTFFPYLTGALGIEYMTGPDLGLNISLGNVYPLREGLDAFPGGSIHDSIWSLSFGLTYYTGW